MSRLANYHPLRRYLGLSCIPDQDHGRCIATSSLPYRLKPLYRLIRGSTLTSRRVVGSCTLRSHTGFMQTDSEMPQGGLQMSLHIPSPRMGRKQLRRVPARPGALPSASGAYRRVPARSRLHPARTGACVPARPGCFRRVLRIG